MRKLHRMLFASALALAGSTASMAQGTISTIAGTGTSGASGDGGDALSATFASPSGVAVDASGNIFIADKNNNKIRKISPSGTISSYAGIGVPGWSAGPALHLPISAFIDASGELLFTGWFSDMGFYTDPSTGTTYARFGCGSQGSTGDGGPACLARTMTPVGSCEDNFGNTYIADYGSNRVRMVNAATGIISTIVNASGAHGYTGDGGLALDAKLQSLGAVFIDPSSPGAGHLYIADAGANVIRKVDLNTSIITTVAGTGVAGYSGNWDLATNAKLRNPGSIFIDAHKNLFFCDRGNNVVRKFNIERKVISTVAGNGTLGFSGDGDASVYGQLNNPMGVWVDNAGDMYIADAGNNRIRKVSVSGVSPITPKGNAGSISGASGETVMVYPNPANGLFNISVGETYANTSVTVLNVLGQQVYNGTLAGQMAQVNLAGMPAGTYTLMLGSGSTQHIEKLTIQ